MQPPTRSTRAKIAAQNTHGRKPGFLFSRKERKGRKVFSATETAANGALIQETC